MEKYFIATLLLATVRNRITYAYSITNHSICRSNQRLDLQLKSKRYLSYNKNHSSLHANKIDDVETPKEKLAKKKVVPSKQKKTDAEEGWITNRSILPKLWDSNNGRCFKILSWNVNGLRAILRKDPMAFSSLVAEQSFPDLICLQETKLQHIHVDDEKLGLNKLLQEEGYKKYWSCSTARKGYSGTAVFVRTHDSKGSKVSSVRLPSSVEYGINCSEHDQEGRSITVHFPTFSIANLYVPNSGQKLSRLQYRMKWDRDLLSYMQNIEKQRDVPLVCLGDLNVAHKRLDVYNDGANHLIKQAGCTPEEKDSFSNILKTGYIDALRELHPKSDGQYTYWSQRTFARKPNRGLRLDYFVCSANLFKQNEGSVHVRDTYILPDQVGSDHCPIVLELELQSNYKGLQ